VTSSGVFKPGNEAKSDVSAITGERSELPYADVSI